MFRYAQAECCYAYLSDILGSCPWIADGAIGNASSSLVVQLAPDDDRNFWHEAFARSVWFTRGWTLQELLAPKMLKFFGSKWNYIGERWSLHKTISKVTHIDPDILSGFSDVSLANVAQKMAWAAGRKTSRIEDQAYSLLGLFGVNMPMLYGEGSKAFHCLQIEIMRATTDQTILTWNGSGQNGNGCLLAQSPADFAQSRKVVRWGSPGSFEMTNRGLRIYVPVLKRETAHGTESLAILNCRYEDDFSGVLALRLQLYKRGVGYHLFLKKEQQTPEAKNLGRLVFVSTHDLSTCDSEKVHIEITQTFEPEFPGVRLWLQMSGPAVIAEANHREGARSIKCTNTSAVVSIPDRAASSGTVGARLTCFSEDTVFIAFGFDKHRLPIEGEVGQLWAWLSLPHDTVRSSDPNVARFGMYDVEGRRTHQFWFRKQRSKSQLEIGDEKIIQAEVALREVLGEEVIVCTVRIAKSESQEPVEIDSASDKGSFAAPSPSAPREDTSPSALSGSSVMASSPADLMRRLGPSGKRRTSHTTAYDCPQVIAPSQEQFGLAR